MALALKVAEGPPREGCRPPYFVADLCQLRLGPEVVGLGRPNPRPLDPPPIDKSAAPRPEAHPHHPPARERHSVGVRSEGALVCVRPRHLHLFGHRRRVPCRAVRLVASTSSRARHHAPILEPSSQPPVPPSPPDIRRLNQQSACSTRARRASGRVLTDQSVLHASQLPARRHRIEPPAALTAHTIPAGAGGARL